MSPKVSQESNTILNRLWSNKMGLICLILLTLITLISLFSYFIIPDDTHNANRQIPQLALQKPGYKMDFYIQEKNINIKSQSLIDVFLFGQRDQYDYVPYDTLWIDEASLLTMYNTVIRYHNYDGAPLSDINSKKKTFWLGTDKYGRDVLSRLILGLRVSMIIGLLSVIVSLTIGITLGSLAGYYGSQIDKMIMLIVNTSWSIPTLLMAFAIIIAFGKGFLVIVLAVGLTMWVDVARIVRGEVMQAKNELYVKASKIMGYSDIRTITKHILPNIVGSILVMAAANFATAILVEAGLSYLGLGIQPPTPSLGSMLKESYAYATGGFVYLAFFPIITIMSLVLCFNLLGTALRDVFDVKSVQPS